MSTKYIKKIFKQRIIRIENIELQSKIEVKLSTPVIEDIFILAITFNRITVNRMS